MTKLYDLTTPEGRQERKRDVIAFKESGHTLEQTAAAFGISRTRAHDLVGVRQKRTHYSKHLGEIIADFRDGMSIMEIARKYVHHQDTVRRVLHKHLTSEEVEKIKEQVAASRPSAKNLYRQQAKERAEAQRQHRLERDAIITQIRLDENLSATAIAIRLRMSHRTVQEACLRLNLPPVKRPDTKKLRAERRAAERAANPKPVKPKVERKPRTAPARALIVRPSRPTPNRVSRNGSNIPFRNRHIYRTEQETAVEARKTRLRTLLTSDRNNRQPAAVTLPRLSFLENDVAR